MVKKNNDKWRMCVDFTDLNKSCPKDAYHLPSIDSLVDNASGYATLSFMDAYSGYNQILMHPSDQNKIVFITKYGNYLYKVMPFRLNNAGATYQRLMDKIFANQIGRNMEVYVDDMVAKTKLGNQHVDDLTKIFNQIRRYNMRLNLKKMCFRCTGRQIFRIFTYKTRYQSRGPIKSHYLADFVAEFTSPNLEAHSMVWTLYMDGASNPQGRSAAVLLEDGNRFVFEHSLHLSFKTSNNQTEYKALIAGLRFGIPRHIIADNDRHFADKKFTSFLQNLKITQHFSSVEHPQTNVLTEAANKVILHALRKKLDDAKGLWTELIPEIIWGYNTTIHSTTKETPF
ncbi:uncharacterized protein LOC107607874 [Arachis ipaensis]|uniref:uncharacterized protein LOC107607874 n=1 Tax=Arachis ipaensis TaxID=130454 RepID=UPI0007AF7780|nr:uncharacterized protein LOC107607874 [Arachis ipaensis]XP_025665270.1 uncharacterized protein LOC112763948 [Arachis hypogaea]